MDFIKSQLARMQQQLNGLGASQKMLAGALVVIMVMTLMWWGRYASQAEMEPVLDQSFGADDISRVTAQLKAKGIDYRVVGDKVLVSADRKFEALADLGYAQLLPRDTKSGFDEIVKQMSPWDPVSKTDVMWNRSKELTLAQVIRNFPGVSNANVIIDPTQERRLNGSIQPSATVNITMRGGEKPGKQLIEAAARTIAGAQAALPLSRIAVIVDGVSYPVHDAGDGSFVANDLIELTQHWERVFVDRIRSNLADIPGLLASVTVDLHTTSLEKQEELYDPTKVAQKEREISSRTEESTAPSGPGGEAGVMANVGTSVSVSGAGTAATSTVEENKTAFETRFSKTVQNEQDTCGQCERSPPCRYVCR